MSFGIGRKDYSWFSIHICSGTCRWRKEMEVELCEICSWCCNIWMIRESWVKGNIPLRWEYIVQISTKVTMPCVLEKRGVFFFFFLNSLWLLVWMNTQNPFSGQTFKKWNVLQWKSTAPMEGWLAICRSVLRACVSPYGCANSNWSDSVKTRQPSLIKASWWH